MNQEIRADNTIFVFLPGITGRMSQEIAQQISKKYTFKLGGCSSQKEMTEEDLKKYSGSSAVVSKTLCGSIATFLKNSKNTVKDKTENTTKIIVDFTAPEALSDHIKAAEDFSCALLVGTTALSLADHKMLLKLAKKVPVLYAANTSIGANLLSNLVTKVAKAIPQADAEILEIHHNQKKDAPSGTALMLAQSIENAHNTHAAQHNIVPKAFQQHIRSGDALRKPGEIGVQALRGANVPGEHTAYFFLDNERIELSHKIQNRSVFASGALVAAQFLVAQKPGLYTMNDVLGLND